MNGRKRRLGLALIVFILSVCVMAIAGYKLRETEQITREGNESYEQLTDSVRQGGPPVFSPEATQPQDESAKTEPIVVVPYMDIDFEALKEINPDAVAWLYCPDTVIDYPVMRADDYSYYLNRLPDGTKNANGSLFIDYNNAPDFSAALTIIYGHHMKSGMMFGSLVGYKKQSYYEEHPFMYLYTGQCNYRLDLMYGCVIDAGQWRERAFMYEANLDALLAYADYNTTFTSEANYKQGDRVVALSTCSYEFDGARYVVLGVLRLEYGD